MAMLEAWLDDTLPIGNDRYQLLEALKDQLNKDLDTQFVSSKPRDLVNDLLEFCKNRDLASEHTRSLLYRVDVGERRLQEMLTQTGLKEYEAVSLAILQREWQKVSFRRKFRSH